MELTKQLPRTGMVDAVIKILDAIHLASEVYVAHAYARPWLADAAARGKPGTSLKAQEIKQ